MAMMKENVENCVSPSERVGTFSRVEKTPESPGSADQATHEMFTMCFSPPRHTKARVTFGGKLFSGEDTQEEPTLRERRQGTPASKTDANNELRELNDAISAEKRKMERYTRLAESAGRSSLSGSPAPWRLLPCREALTPRDTESREAARHVAALRLQTLLHHKRAQRAFAQTVKLEKAERARRDALERGEKDARVLDFHQRRVEDQLRFQLASAERERAALEAKLKAAMDDNAKLREDLLNGPSQEGEQQEAIARVVVNDDRRGREIEALGAEVEALKAARSDEREALEAELEALTTSKNSEIEALRAEVDEEKSTSRREREERELASARRIASLERDLDAAIGEQRRVVEEGEALRRDLVAEFEARRSDLEAKLEARRRDLEASVEARVEREAREATRRALDAEEARQHAEASFEADRRAWDAVRRTLHNRVVELRGNIRTFVRVRPAVDVAKTGQPAATSVACPRPPAGASGEMVEVPETVAAGGPPRKARTFRFAFDRVFSPRADQATVFAEVEPFVRSAIDGFAVCVFAYGQTGSGKTHTTLGSPEHPGILGRSLDRVFEAIADLEPRWRFDVHVEMLEIYLEKVYDLLASDDGAPLVACDQGDQVPKIANQTRLPVDSPRAAAAVLAKAQKRRKVGATKSNANSSRSHCIFSLRLNGTDGVETSSGVFNLVDLAGSERLSISGSNDDKRLLKEAQAINSSLAALGNVISALSSTPPASHVPYRDSKLTFLLQPFLGGDAKTLAIINVAPETIHERETLCSLRFAQKVSRCVPTTTSSTSSSAKPMATTTTMTTTTK
ncbi:hypothetical protein CTAYLR_007135 [Chrysophaeum taylorii]|uniref:Kinesin-like protein n=1 Tax=Chrysophaeum taylorii TaxID=2483200 RepID=A0AAD7XFP5_9STRA|nr:hypothetical protein CTAYLR_007135 [Chrysophaeum taylorii]